MKSWWLLLCHLMAHTSAFDVEDSALEAALANSAKKIASPFFDSSDAAAAAQPAPQQEAVVEKVATAPEILKQLRDDMDMSVSPCDNFYRYACGSFQDRNAGTKKSRSFGQLNTQKDAVVKRLLDGDTPKVSSFFKDCMAVEQREEKQTTPLVQWYREINRIKNISEIYNVAGKLTAFGVEALFELDVDISEKQPDKYESIIAVGGVGMKPIAYLQMDIETKTLYEKHISDMLEATSAISFTGECKKLEKCDLYMKGAGCADVVASNVLKFETLLVLTMLLQFRGGGLLLGNNIPQQGIPQIPEQQEEATSVFVSVPTDLKTFTDWDMQPLIDIAQEKLKGPTKHHKDQLSKNHYHQFLARRLQGQRRGLILNAQEQEQMEQEQQQMAEDPNVHLPVPDAPWPEFFSGLGYMELLDQLGGEIQVDTTLSSAVELIKMVPVEVHQAYLRWRLASSVNIALTPDLERIASNFVRNMTGITELTPISEKVDKKIVTKRCSRQIENMLPFLLGKYYSDEVLPGEAQKMAINVIEQVQKAFGLAIDYDLGWMDEGTKVGAREKLRVMVNKIGNPDLVALINMLANELPAKDPLLNQLHRMLRARASATNLGSTPGTVLAPETNGTTNMLSPGTTFIDQSAFKLDSQLDYSKDIDTNRQLPELADNGEGYFGQFMAVSNFMAYRDLKKIGKAADRGEWLMSPQTVNAYYQPLWNEIVFPAAILQPPMFKVDMPAAINFGGIGSVMGHEIIHGFDNSGSQYDAKGLKRNWWNATAKQAFLAKARCVAQYYQAFTMETGAHLNGMTTLGENIADIGGLKYSYKAYKMWQEEGRDTYADTIPSDFGLSQDQTFFVAFAQNWCAVQTPEDEEKQSKSDVHSPPRFRVNGAVANNPYFGEIFQCPADSPMNPVHKCDMW